MRAPPKCNPTGGFFSFRLGHELIEPIRVDALFESEGVGFNLEANDAGSLGRDSQMRRRARVAWVIVFRWRNGQASSVQVVDYH